MFGPAKTVVGPHVIVKTNETIRVHDQVDNFHGEVPMWECQYCGATGTHPDAEGHNLSWRKACEEFEPLESEKELLR